MTAKRRRIPLAIRATAAAGLLLTAFYAALYGAMRSADPDFAATMLRMYGLTIVAGRETAMFDALNHGMAPLWVYGLSVVDDVGSLLLALPFAWAVMRFLRRFGPVRWAFARVEKQALLHRAWVHRWGLGGLALFYYLPGFGAGVPITVVLGLLARIPFARLVPFFVVATLAVNGLWALLLVNALRLLPEAPWVDAVPLVVIGLALASTLVGMWRGRAERHVALLDWPIAPNREELARLESAGLTMQKGLVRADLEVLRGILGGVERHMGRLLAVADLLVLDGMRPKEALALVDAGVAGIEDLAVSDEDALAKKASLAGIEWSGRSGPWIAQARSLVEGQHAGWSHRGRSG